MSRVKEIRSFSYGLYNRILALKFGEVVVKEFLKFFLFSTSHQERRFFLERLGFLPASLNAHGSDKWVWVHTNALGEVNASYELIRIIKERYPKARVLLTTSNFSADNRAQQIKIVDAVVFFPYDLPFIVEKFIRYFKPVAVVIIEIDIWPNFVKACKRNGIPVFLVSGIFSDRTVRTIGLRYLYNYIFRLSKEVFENIECFCMQEQNDVDGLLSRIPDHKRVYECGNLKFSRANNVFLSEQDYVGYKNIFNITLDDSVLVAGNVHLLEAETLLSAFKKVRDGIPRAMMILAPRLLDEVPAFESLLKVQGLRYVKKTVLSEKRVRDKEEVLILDTIGELAGVYFLANAAFVGGSLAYLGEVFGGHNILEPARFGVPVIFGPHMHNFRTIADLFLQKKIAVEVSDADNLAESIVESFIDEKRRELVRLMAREIFEQNSNVAEKIFDTLKPSLDAGIDIPDYPRECLVCAGRDLKFLVRQDKYKIFRCRACGLVFSYPLPSNEELDSFYQNFAFNEFEGKYIDENDRIAEYVTVKQLGFLTRMGHDIRGGRFLDIGCGNGFYLHGAKACGFETFGIEKDKTAAESAMSRYRAKVFSCELKECDFPQGYFDIIKMRQFIEHLPYPAEYLREVNRILADKGVLIIETVNTQSLEVITRLYFLDAFKKIKSYMPELRLMKKIFLSIRREWGFTDPPRHLYGFSRGNLGLLLINSGFSPLKIFTATMGDKVYYPVSQGHLSFLRKNEEEALCRLYKKSKVIYIFYRFIFKPAMVVLKLYIKLSASGSHLIAYSVKKPVERNA